MAFLRCSSVLLQEIRSLTARIVVVYIGILEILRLLRFFAILIPTVRFGAVF